ncbi:MAG: methyltransferase domain-containing protein, partial [Candidatus Diapherotrites archaeon]|nr:methyltransferase domain-containing protein [Candidatus Diapherotrites archaeon]
MSTTNPVTKQIVEGTTKLIVPDEAHYFSKEPKGKSTYVPSTLPVFFNQMMVLSRDITVVYAKYIKQKFKKLRVIDPFCATGARGIRIANEAEADHLILSDFNPTACFLAEKNTKLNNLENTEIINQDANTILCQSTAINFVELDPFGSPAPFLDSAIRSIKKGTLSLSATDLAALTGTYPNVALRKYGLRPFKSDFSKELAMRILATSIIWLAAKHDRTVDFELSFYDTHHVKMFCFIKHGKEKTLKMIQSLAYLNLCQKCFHRFESKEKQTTCPHCQNKIFSCGPIYTGNTSNKKTVLNCLEIAKKSKLSAQKKAIKTLDLIAGELENPFYFDIHKICDHFNIPCISTNAMIEGLKKEGFNATLTHFSPTSVKTGASIDVVESVIHKTLEN